MFLDCFPIAGGQGPSVGVSVRGVVLPVGPVSPARTPASTGDVRKVHCVCTKAGRLGTRPPPSAASMPPLVWPDQRGGAPCTLGHPEVDACTYGACCVTGPLGHSAFQHVTPENNGIVSRSCDAVVTHRECPMDVRSSSKIPSTGKCLLLSQCHLSPPLYFSIREETQDRLGTKAAVGCKIPLIPY